MAMTIDTTNLCSHLQKKLFEPEGVYYPIWQAMQNDEELTAVVRSRQLHIYRNGKKILILAGKAIGCIGYYTHETSNISIGENDCEVGYSI